MQLAGMVIAVDASGSEVIGVRLGINEFSGAGVNVSSPASGIIACCVWLSPSVVVAIFISV